MLRLFADCSVFMTFVACGAALLAVPSMFRCIRALWKLHKAGKFEWSPSVTCLVIITISSAYGMAYNFEHWVRKFFNCAVDGGSNEVVDIIISFGTSMFGVCFILSVIQVLLMWIDVHIKSKSMQKVGAGNSLVGVYKKALRISSIVFTVVFVAAYSVSSAIAVA